MVLTVSTVCLFLESTPSTLASLPSSDWLVVGDWEPEAGRFSNICWSRVVACDKQYPEHAVVGAGSSGAVLGDLTARAPESMSVVLTLTWVEIGTGEDVRVVLTVAEWSMLASSNSEKDSSDEMRDIWERCGGSADCTGPRPSKKQWSLWSGEKLKLEEWLSESKSMVSGPGKEMAGDPKRSAAWKGFSGEVVSGGVRRVLRLMCADVTMFGPHSEGVEMADGVEVGQPWPNRKADEEMRGSLCRCLVRPARRVTRYSQVRPRFSQRSQVGFFLLHLTLEAEQAWQLSRSLGAGRVLPEVLLGVEQGEERAVAVCAGLWYMRTCTESSVLTMVCG